MAGDNETTGTGINWAKVAVRDAHGAIDVDSTMELIRDELTDVAGSEVDTTEIAAAVDAVFAKLTNGGQVQKATIDLSGLASRALNLLGDVPFGQESKLTERVKEYVRGESERFVATEGAEGKMVVRKGKSGGVSPSTPKIVEEYRAFLAKKAAKNAPAAQ
jgi:hypothetical protein